ncbi:hypothetical protein SEA_PIONEER3_51 [Microbacterium phage Pioneer3]|nr:hypothetical protein SEA_PIONEER3_51 [Microbacterium phage Pioneer3]
MTRPKLILPSLSMPWGRWVEEGLDEVEAGLERQTQDSNSTGNLFAARAELIQGQIQSIPSVAATYSLSLPPFTRTLPSNTDATAYVYTTGQQTFNPPRPNLPYNFQVIAVMGAEGLNMPFSRSIIRANGHDNIYQHENMQPGFQTQATYSISASGSIVAGEVVNVDCGMVVSESGTLSFNRVNIYCTFTGRIL